MMQLTEELTSTENKVSFSRQSYNDAVMAYNTQREFLADASSVQFTRNLAGLSGALTQTK